MYRAITFQIRKGESCCHTRHQPQNDFFVCKRLVDKWLDDMENIFQQEWEAIIVSNKGTYARKRAGKWEIL